MNIRNEITIKTCEGCPFYERTLLSTIADAFAKDGRKTGACKYSAHGRTFPFGRVHIADPSTSPPDNCPLRTGETIIKVAGP